MRIAIEMARAGVEKGQSPFGACIVRRDDVVAANHNEVMLTNDMLMNIYVF